MINKLLQIIAPHHCYGCRKTGTLLCDNCKYDIVEESFDACIVCLSPTPIGICAGCRTSYVRAWFVGERTEVLRQLIDALKFKRVRSSAEALAGLVDLRLPVLPSNTVIVPVPTLARHVRQRGYDHCFLIARHLAKRRGVPLARLVKRQTSTVQRGMTKKHRMIQAGESFVCSGPIDPDATYLVLDDVVTTNATVRYVAESLAQAGARNIWVVAVARQPLEKQR
mgnify:CR=1 FL=1